MSASAATDASASESYPLAIERALDTPCPPDCTTCHTRAEGGELTANTPFGIAARRAGLECCDTGLLLDVLATLETNGADSDTDGTSDVDELRAGTDPNALEGKLECYEPPAGEGCAVNSCSTTKSPTAGGLVAVVALLSLVRLRRKRRGRRRLWLRRRA